MWSTHVWSVASSAWSTPAAWKWLGPTSTETTLSGEGLKNVILCWLISKLRVTQCARPSVSSLRTHGCTSYSQALALTHFCFGSYTLKLRHGSFSYISVVASFCLFSLLCVSRMHHHGKHEACTEKIWSGGHKSTQHTESTTLVVFSRVSFKVLQIERIWDEKTLNKNYHPQFSLSHCYAITLWCFACDCLLFQTHIM